MVFTSLLSLGRDLKEQGESRAPLEYIYCSQKLRSYPNLRHNWFVPPSVVNKHKAAGDKGPVHPSM